MRSLVMLCCAALVSLALCAPPAAAQTVGYLYINNNSSPNTVSAFAVQANGDLAAVAGSPFLTGGSPGFCTAMDTVAIDTLRRRLYLTNGNSNNVSGFNIAGNGALTPISGSPFAAGTLPTGAVFDPQGRFLIVGNENNTTVWVYSINAASGQLTKVSEAAVPTAHAMEFHPSGNFLYVTSFNNTIYAFSISGSGVLTPVPGSPYTGLNNPHGSDITPDGKFLYVANAGNTTVSAFSINQTTGALTPVSGSPFATGFTGIAVNPAGTRLFTHANSNQLRSFTINTTTGALTSVGLFSNSAGATTPWAQVVSPDGQRLYALDGSAHVSTFDIAAGGSLTSHTGSPYARGASGCSGGIALLKPPVAQAGQVVISEFRLNGTDEFIEFYNNTDTAMPVAGFTLEVSNGTTLGLPASAVIPPRGHFLFTRSASWSLAAYAAPNDIYGPDLPHNAGMRLKGSDGTVLDSVAFDTTGVAGYGEGTPLPTVDSLDQIAWVRDLSTDRPKDTNNNASDFVLVSTTGAAYGGVQSRLGAPGPENTDSPIDRSSKFSTLMLDSTQASTMTPNRDRNFTPDAANNSSQGTMTIRRRFVNNTGAAVTRLRFRVIIITGSPVPDAATADLRVRSSSDSSVSNVNDSATCSPSAPPCTVTVRGVTLEAPSPSNNGGLNSSLVLSSVTSAPEEIEEFVPIGGRMPPTGASAQIDPSPGGEGEGEGDTINLATPLANNASINVQFLFGVQQPGKYRFYVTIEALP